MKQTGCAMFVTFFVALYLLSSFSYYVLGSEIINQGIELQTELGANAQDILLRGEAIPEEVCAKVLLDKISSPEVAHHGYVLDGFPSLCEDWLSMADQLDLVKNLPLTPDFIINLKVRKAPFMWHF